MDGTSVNGNSRDGIANLTPEPDSVAQMKVSTDVFSADKGHQSARVLIEVFTKPGSNQFSWDTHRSFIPAPAPTAKTEFAPVPRYLRNDFGGSFGGPIRKDQTFFFGSIFWSKGLQGTDRGVAHGDAAAIAVLCQHQRFSKFDGRSSSSRMLRRARAVPTSNFYTARPGSSKTTRTGIYPIPGYPRRSASAWQRRPSVSQPNLNNGFQGHARIDHNFHNGRTTELFYSLFRNTTKGGSLRVTSGLLLAYVSPNANWYHKFDYVHTFSARIVNEASISYGSR